MSSFSSIRSLPQQLRRCWRLPPRDRGDLCRVWLILPLVAGALWRFPYVKVQQWLGSQTPIFAPVEGAPDQCDDARRLARIVTLAASVQLVPVTCLTRYLTLWWLLRRHGIEAHLHVDRAAGQRQSTAQAWITYRELTFGEPAGSSRRHDR